LGWLDHKNHTSPWRIRAPPIGCKGRAPPLRVLRVPRARLFGILGQVERTPPLGVPVATP